MYKKYKCYDRDFKETSEKYYSYNRPHGGINIHHMVLVSKQ